MRASGIRCSDLCIDDTRNYALWLSIVPYAKKLGLNITLSLNVEALTPEIWKSIIPANNDRFELASHGATHTSLIARDALRLGGDILVSQSTTVDIDADENFTIWTDGKPAYARELGAEPNITLGELTKDLEEKGFRAQLVDLSYRNLPARLLQDVKGQDIHFSNYEPIFILDTKKYQHWTLRESRKAIEGLKAIQCTTKKTSLSLLRPTRKMDLESCPPWTTQVTPLPEANLTAVTMFPPQRSEPIFYAQQLAGKVFCNNAH